MRKAGAKEDLDGSIGFEGAINVNCSPVSAKTAGRRSDLMICRCSCTGRSSSLRNLNNTNISMICKGCGGETVSDRGELSCSSKINTMVFELPRPIDPEVRWKTVNRRRRASRRARTSFSGEDRIQDEIRSFYACGSGMSQDTAQEDSPASEYEFGVSILGRRFSDPMEKAPIKKRRFHLDCSPSPPPTPLPVDPCEKILSRSSGGISSYGKHHTVKMLGCEEKKGPFDTADFSGISILADVACESEMDATILNGECLKSASIGERKLENMADSSELGYPHEIKDDKLNIPDASCCKLVKPLKSSETAPDMKPLFPCTLNSSESTPDIKPLFPTTSNNSGNHLESAAVSRANSAPHSSLSNANKTDDFFSPFDTKSSDVAMINNSNNLDKSVDCFGDVVVQTKAVHDSRLHWDLNVEMDAWDTLSVDDHDIIGPDNIAPGLSAEKERSKVQACQDLFDSAVAVGISELSGEGIHVVDIPKDVKTKGGSDLPGDGSSHPSHSLSPQNLQLLESESLDGNDCSAKTNDLPDQQKSSCVTKVELHLGSNPDFSSLTPSKEHIAAAANVDNLGVSHDSSLDYESLYHLASEAGHGGELGSIVKPLTSRLVSEESTNVITIIVSNKSHTDVVSSDDKLGQASLQSISEIKSQELLDADSGTSKIDRPVSDRDEHGNDVLHIAKRAANADTDLNTPDPHPENNLVSCNMAHVNKDGVDATVNKNRLITCANSSSTETHYITSDAPRALALDSECNKQAATDMDSIVDSQSAVQSYPNGYENKIQKVASNNYLENCHETDRSKIGKDLSVSKKVDAGEGGSQYEDGELIESGDLYWADDGYEEVKCVNQISDNKDEEAAPDIHPEPVGSSKNIGISAADYNVSRKEYGDISLVSSKRSWSTNCLDDGSGTVCAARAGEKAHSVHLSVNVKSETRMYEINPFSLIAGSAMTAGQSERDSDPSGADPSFIRPKPTGWDMLPEDQRHARYASRDGADSSKQCVLGTLDAVGSGESFQLMGLSKRDVPSQLDRSRSVDRPHRNEQSRSDDGCGSGSKAERTIDGHISHGRSGASRQVQASGQGEQWLENSNSSCSNQRRSPSYYNYGPPGPRNAAEAAVAKMENNGFVVAPDGTLVRAIDAANASNMARRMRYTSSSNHSPLSGQGSPIDRDGGCGFSRGPSHAREAPPERRFGGSSNRSARYDPEMDKDHTADGNLCSIRCLLPNKQRRFPPHGASLNISRTHSRSPSGSRSRSPHAWTSPRNRREIMANGGSSKRRHSRSPNYMTEVRIGRVTSPRRQPGFSDRVILDIPSSRNRTYSQHDSTWADGRNCSTIDMSDSKKQYSKRNSPRRITSRNGRFDDSQHDSTWADGRNCSTIDMSDSKKQYSKRNSPPRITSRNGRFDVMDSQGRPRSREFHRPTQERLPYGFERGNKHGRNGVDKREYDNRYETVKPYDRSVTVKQFRNHTGDKLHPRISAPRSPEPQRRGSPRRF